MNKQEKQDQIQKAQHKAMTPKEVIVALAEREAPAIDFKYPNSNKVEFQFLPISYLEAEMDRVFGAANWGERNLIVSYPGGYEKNGKKFMFCQVQLEVFFRSPHTGEEISRVGIGSGEFTASQIVTGPAKIKAFAFKNALQSIGNRFGRDLNRKFQEELTGESTADLWEAKLQACETVEELVKQFKSMPQSLQSDKEMKDIAAQIRKEIQNAK